MARSVGKGRPEDSFVVFDVGTSVSRIAYGRGQSGALVSDVTGETRIPSVMALSEDGGILVGRAAEPHRVLAPEMSIEGLKLLLVQEKASVEGRGAFWPHPVRSEEGQLLSLEVGARRRSVVEMLAAFIAHLRRTAEIALERGIGSAVLTVPASYSPFDREMLRLAAKMGGLKDVRLIDEPSAAALAWAAQGGRGRAAVCSWGAGFFSAAILEVREDQVKTLAIAGSKEIGGLQVDLTLARDFLESARQAKGGDFENASCVAAYVLAAAETAKRDLAARGKAEMRLPLSGDEGPFKKTYGKEHLEGWLTPLKESAEALCNSLLLESGLTPADLDALVLVGGMFRLEPLKEAVQSVFARGAAEGLETEEAVALGALSRARFLDHAVPGPLVLDCLPSALGLEERSGGIAAILERTTTTPASRVELFTTYLDKQTEVSVPLYARGSGEWDRIAHLKISRIPSMKAGQASLELAILVDEDGTLQAQARETSKGRDLDVDICPVRGLRSASVAAILDAVGSQESAEDFEAQLRAELRMRARYLLATIRQVIVKYPGMMARDEKQLIRSKSEELEEVLEGADLSEMRTCWQELEEAARPLMQRLYDAGLKSLLR